MPPMPRRKKITRDTALYDFMHTIVPLGDAEREYLITHSFPLSVRKGTLLSRPGSEERVLYLIKKGVVRSYTMDGLRQVTTWINEEWEIVAPGHTFGLPLPSVEYLQTLEATELCGIAYEHIEYMYDHFPVANKIGRLLLEDNYRGAEERALLGRISSATKRYQRLMERHPSLLTRVPLKYIASYLNMSLETLSRVRSKFRG